MQVSGRPPRWAVRCSGERGRKGRRLRGRSWPRRVWVAGASGGRPAWAASSCPPLSLPGPCGSQFRSPPCAARRLTRELGRLGFSGQRGRSGRCQRRPLWPAPSAPGRRGSALDPRPRVYHPSTSKGHETKPARARESVSRAAKPMTFPPSTVHVLSLTPSQGLPAERCS